MASKSTNENVICISAFRREKKLRYIAEHESHLREFFNRFVDHHFQINFGFINDVYMQRKVSQNEMAWDFHDFREELKHAIYTVYGDAIWSELIKEKWFNPVWLSRDEMAERCTSAFILAEGKAANQ